MGLTECDKAWLAGLYEGEGSVSLQHDRHLYIKITQKETRLLRVIQRMVGFGPVYSEYKGTFRISKWMVSGRDALCFIATIQPFMKSKRKVAQINRALRQYARSGITHRKMMKSA